MVKPFLDCAQTLIISAAGHAFLRLREDMTLGKERFCLALIARALENLSPAGVAQGFILSHERRNDRAEVKLMPRKRSCRRNARAEELITRARMQAISFSIS